jgi:hypothetical protein
VFCVPYRESRPAIYNPATNTLATVSSNFPVQSLNNRWAGVTLTASGNVYLPGYSSTSSLIYNPTTDTTTVAGGTLPGDGAYRTAILMPDGKVFLVPYNALEARIYDPVANTTSVVSGDYPVCEEHVFLTPQINVPANSSVSIPIQGLRLLCRAVQTASSVYGGRLLAKAQVSNAIKVIGSATELEASDHAPNNEGV